MFAFPLILSACAEYICWYIFNPLNIQIVTGKYLPLVVTVLFSTYNGAFASGNAHDCNKMQIFCFSLLYHVSVWCYINPVSLHSYSKFHLIIMFITLAGAVSNICRNSINPPTGFAEPLVMILLWCRYLWLLNQTDLHNDLKNWLNYWSRLMLHWCWALKVATGWDCCQFRVTMSCCRETSLRTSWAFSSCLRYS